MAALLGVSKSQVARDKAAGMPMDSAEAARAWRDAQLDLSRTAHGRIDRPGAPDPLPAAAADPAADLAVDNLPDTDTAAAEPDSEDTLKFRKARAEREAINAATSRIELDKLQGSVIDLVEAQRLAFTAFRSLRDALLNVPARIKDQLAMTADPAACEALLETEIAGALSSLDPDRVLAATADDDDEAG